MREYYSSDELMHWGLPGGKHKYIAKIGEGKAAKYFYTQEQLDAYKNGLSGKVQRGATNVAGKAALWAGKQAAKSAFNYAKEAVNPTRSGPFAEQRHKMEMAKDKFLFDNAVKNTKQAAGIYAKGKMHEANMGIQSAARGAVNAITSAPGAAASVAGGARNAIKNAVKNRINQVKNQRAQQQRAAATDALRADRERAQAASNAQAINDKYKFRAEQAAGQRYANAERAASASRQAGRARTAQALHNREVQNGSQYAEAERAAAASRNQGRAETRYTLGTRQKTNEYYERKDAERASRIHADAERAASASRTHARSKKKRNDMARTLGRDSARMQYDRIHRLQ